MMNVDAVSVLAILALVGTVVVIGVISLLVVRKINNSPESKD